MPILQDRRHFLAALSSVGVAGLVGARRSSAQEAPPETTTIRLVKTDGICIAAQYLANELLRLEGFVDIQYVTMPASLDTQAIGRGEVDMSMDFVAQFIPAIEAGVPITILAGVHVGCFELFAHEDIRGIRDLKGRKVGTQALGLAPHVLVTTMAANVGLDPKDIDWVLTPTVDPIELFTEGKIDAFLGIPPEPQLLRARKIGHVIVNSAVDRPWSQYFCCMLAGNRDFVRKHPVATKRVLRAILKAADLCASDPVGAARRMVDGGFTARYDPALQTLQELPYNKWREYDSEDTIRFYSLRLREGGFIKSNPTKIVADGTNWRFLDQLKQELKG